MADLSWMPDILRGAGMQVREVPGWQTRSHGAMANVVGVLCHHTAGPAVGDFPSERVVVNGRTGLAGPLCNLGLTRAGVWVIIAAGQAWHAGTGSVPWCPMNQGNSHLIGVEAESVGTRDDWTAAQQDSYPRGVAALLGHLRLPATRAIGHKEWAPGRKVDPAFWDMGAFRADVARHLAPSPTPRPAASTPGGDWFAMASEADLRRIMREEILQALVPDYFTADDKDRMWLSECLAWGTTHAAHARDAARAGLAKATTLESKVDALLARVVSGTTTGPSGLSDTDVDRIVTALVKRSRAPLA